MTSEKIRQREVHKYYQSWLDSSVSLDGSSQLLRQNADGSRIRVSKDKALIAFAQLGCLRLDVKRGLVTLISTDQQYILAEATKTLSLVSGDGDLEAQDEIWFGSASLPRGQGISGDALSPSLYTATAQNGASYTAPALVVDDITKHEDYRSRGYAGKGVTFYCGVPIVTDSGFPIGVYTVTDDKPRSGLALGELRFMHDMAATVMRHLESVSNEAARFRGETMVLGLGKFISGAPSMHEDTPTNYEQSPRGTASNQSTAAESRVRVFKGIEVTTSNPALFRHTNKDEQSPGQPPSTKQVDQDMLVHHTDTGLREASTFTSAPAPPHIPSGSVLDNNRSTTTATRLRSDTDSRVTPDSDALFSRAARILQECVAADGVLFFDAVSSNFTQRTKSLGPDLSREPTHDAVAVQELSMQTSTNAVAYTEQKNQHAATYSGASEESDIGQFGEAEKRMSKLLGYAFDDSALTPPDVDVLDNIQMTERSLGRLVKMYPHGKLFTFHVDSGFAASDGEHLTEDVLHYDETRPAKSKRFTMADNSKRIPRAITDELERLVPNAQSVVWLPLWDFTKQRWSAGLFLWSRRIDRLVAAQDDLVYLKAFANSIMVDVARRDAAMADTAKSTFIANISHELRTPLHGILGNLDILQDTKVNEFQQSLITAIEVCGRTLSDTIDHVLDYSKINQLSKNSRKRNKSNSLLSSLSQNPPSKSPTSMSEEDFDIAAVIEEAVEAAYASHTFQSTGRTRLRASSINGEHQPSSPSVVQKKAQTVHVTIDIEYRKSWWVHSQPSAVRRVVTNLFGNALKYTDSGTIQVMLSSRRTAKTSTPMSQTPILLTVKDTGRGMSPDFVRNHAFMPFSQESQFSTGIGLGLSIVQQIVKSLGGKVELQSDQGVGTEIRVLLNLPVTQREDNASQNIADVVLTTLPIEHTAIRILPAENTDDGPDQVGLLPIMSSLGTTSRSWFRLQSTETALTNGMRLALTILLSPPSPDHLQQIMLSSQGLAEHRIFVVAANAIEKADLMRKYLGMDRQSSLRVSVLSHPIGPQKLGKALIGCWRNEQPTDHARTRQEASLSPTLMSAMTEKMVFSSQADEMNEEHADPPVTCDVRSLQQPPQSNLVPTNSLEQPPTRQPPRKKNKTSASHQLLEGVGKSKDLVQEDPAVEIPPLRPVVTPRSISAPAPLLPSTQGATDEPLLRILLVDDNDINLTILKTCMKRAQIAYDSAKDGLQATVAFENATNTKRPFSHVLMDISMPVMDGIQATREIRDFERRQINLQRISSRTAENEKTTVNVADAKASDSEDLTATARAIVIALSGVAAESTQQEMLEAGADMFLPKPVKLKELLRILRT